MWTLKCTFIIIMNILGVPSFNPFCGQETFRESHATIKTNNSWDVTNCTWFIYTDGSVITTIRLIKNTFHKANLTIGSLNISKPSLYSTNLSNIAIKLVPHDHGDLLIQYSTRSSNKCKEFEFQCEDQSACFDKKDICNGFPNCHDRTDEIYCGNCPVPEQTKCNPYSTHCFDPRIHLCDKVFQCPKGEDELNCTQLCPGSIKCFRESKCIPSKKICDYIQDCSNSFDEKHCNSFCDPESSFLCDNGKCISKVFLGNNENDCGDNSDEIFANKLYGVCFLGFVMVLLFSFFVFVIIKWHSNRWNGQRLIQDLPQIQLPPFQGPSERVNSGELMLCERDFLHGGEIFDSYVRSCRENRRRRRRKVPSERQTEEVEDLGAELLDLKSSEEQKCVGQEPDLVRSQSAKNSIDDVCVHTNLSTFVALSTASSNIKPYNNTTRNARTESSHTNIPHEESSISNLFK